MATSKRPILPVTGERNVLFTSALPYVNNVPHHLGNIIVRVRDADVFARYCRLWGYIPIDIYGTDEYGTATETKAVDENCSPKEICDKYHAIHKQVYEWFNISFDEFGRTSTPQQTEVYQSVFHKLMDDHGLSENTMQQLCCDTCQKFLADRLVEGACPTPGCNYDSARGDQFENYSQLLNPTDLKDPKCKACQSSPWIRGTDHLFLELPLLKDKWEEYINKMPQAGSWSQNAIHVTNGWLKGELRSRCITRDLKWGVPVPHEKYKDKTEGSSAQSHREPYILLVAPTCRCNQQWRDPMIDEARISLLNHRRAANLKGQPSNVTESRAWFYTVIAYPPSEIIWKIKNGLPTKNVEFYQDPSINDGWVDIRPQPREDDVQVYHLESDHTPCRGPRINEAKISLLNEDWVVLRAQDIVRADNEQIYGGGESSTVVQQTDFRNATPASDQPSTRQLGSWYSRLGQRMKQRFKW